MANTENLNSTKSDILDNNSGIVNLIQDEDGNPISITNVAFDFSNDESAFLIDCRGRNFAGLYLTTTGEDIGVGVNLTTVEYDTLDDLVDGDFDIVSYEVATYSASANNRDYHTLDVNLRENEGVLATAIVVFFKLNSAGDPATVVGGLRSLNKI